MIVFILFFSTFASGLSFTNYNFKRKNNFPVVGIVSTPCDDTFNTTGARSYIAASYVKFLESGGIRVVPILYNYTYEEIDFLMSKINGVYLIGGKTKLTSVIDGQEYWHEYLNKSAYIVNKVIEKNRNGEYFPYVGVCMGAQLLHIALTEHCECAMQYTDALNFRSNLMFTDSVPKSRLFGNADPRMLYEMAYKNITYQNHKYGFYPSLYTDNPKVSSMLRPLAVSYDRLGVLNVVISEGIDIPFYATMIHPEKPAYEWFSLKINHNITAIEVGHYFATFYATEFGKNTNTFGNYTEYQKYSILNHQVYYLHRPLEQAYLFF
ncbi:GGH1_5 [Blepharisma stoltei]|uniref:folate gamma-glutamyl hydrolase n=1 Tax=Blepharisma stoltei TaxID=1481888 RepID=A0AAU9KE50_9CILI|nr:unnamed protein product [Blepharisma stoltei]